MHDSHKIDLLHHKGGEEINLYAKRFDKTPMEKARKEFIDGVGIIIGLKNVPVGARVSVFSSLNGGAEEETKVFDFREWAGLQAPVQEEEDAPPEREV